MRQNIDGHRYYNLEGEQFPSVTSVLSIISKGQALLNWAAKQGSVEKMQAVQKHALDVGSVVHKLIESHLKNEEYTVDDKPPQVKQAFNNFLSWAEQVNFKMIHSEMVCYSKKFQYAGTIDSIAYLKDAAGHELLTLLDWKSSSGIYVDYFLQTEAYARAAMEMAENGTLQLPGTLEQKAILRFSKTDAVFEPVIEPINLKDFLTFLNALDLFNGMKDLNKRYEKYKKTYGKK